MDKKYIHIDDLSRQLLGQREEEPRPGAWLGMRELLDKEMPVGVLPVAGFGWKRYLGAALVLLLISIATVNGYRTTQSEAVSRQAVQGLAAAAGHLPAAIAAPQATPEVFRQPSGSNTGHVVASLSSTRAAGTLLSEVRPHSTNNPSSGNRNNKNNKIQQSQQTAAGSMVGTQRHHVAETAPAGQQPLPVLTASTHKMFSYSPVVHPSLKAQEAFHTVASAEKTNLAATPEQPATADVTMANVPATAASLRSNKAKEQPVTGTEILSADKKVIAANKVVASKKVNNKPAAPKKQMVLVRDTIQQIQLAQRMVPRKNMRGFELKYDTISISDLVQERWVAAGPAYKGIGPMPASALPAENAVVQAAPPVLPTEDGAGKYVALSGQQVSSRKIKTGGITLRDRLQLAMFQLSQIKAYTGLVAGVDVSPFSKTPTYGFQLGLSQAFQLNPEWTVVAEFKYSRQMGKDLTLRDNYASSYNMSSSQQGTHTVYNWEQDSVEHYFKVPALQSVVVPVSLQYNLNRMFFMGGINFTYSPRVNSEEITRKRNQPTSQSYTSSSPNMQLPPGYQEGLPSVRIDDFGSRFSLGYQIGVGYELSPALKLDVRCTQQFWDNAHTPGAKKVSKEFFRMPNLQLSVGYRFGKAR